MGESVISSHPRPSGSTAQEGELSGEPFDEEEAVWRLACELAGADSPAAVAVAVAEHGADAARGLRQHGNPGGGIRRDPRRPSPAYRTRRCASLENSR